MATTPFIEIQCGGGRQWVSALAWFYVQGVLVDVMAKADVMMKHKGQPEYPRELICWIMGKAENKMKTVLNLVLWLTTFILGSLLAGIFFDDGTWMYYLTFVLCPFFVAFILLRFFSKNGYLITVRALTVIFLELAAAFLIVFLKR